MDKFQKWPRFERPKRKGKIKVQRKKRNRGPQGYRIKVQLEIGKYKGGDKKKAIPKTTM